MNKVLSLILVGFVSVPAFAVVDKKVSKEMMMSMHAPMMAQPMVVGVHPDISFLQNMIPHHQGAIDSSKIVLNSTRSTQISNIAQRIIKAQEAEIKAFNNLIMILQTEKPVMADATIKAFDKDAKKMMSGMMKAMGRVKNTGDVDRDFLAGMVAHHQGAVDASKQVLTVSTDPRIRKIAETIIADQETEIAEFQKILGSM
ncbi:MAG: DUF305 domain-containing protein [Brevinema sp.]